MKRSLLLLFLVIPVTAQAQSRRTAPRCTDTLVGAQWRLTPISATVSEPAAGDRDRDRYLVALLQKVGTGYRDPNGTHIPTDGVVTVTPLEQRRALEAGVELLLDKDGKVLHARISRGSGSPSLDSALVLAARNGAGARGYGRPPRAMRRDTIRLALRFADRDLPTDAVRIGGIATSYLLADVPPRIREMPPARAPRSARGKEVVLAGTVDQRGRVIPSTIRVVSAADSSLITAARKRMEGTTFHPGTFHGCPAESPIRFPIKF